MLIHSALRTPTTPASAPVASAPIGSATPFTA